ncbi:MAG TPA: DNA polymerase III subunit delta [Pseudolabrys sp.]|nr:DNA polymerase III subunit delta [Pseudolabrys sp.]
MTALKASDVDRFIARPDPRQPIVLIYGPDAGLVRERVDALVRASVDDPNDPFALARITGEDISANPSRLVEEAHTVPLFGGRRAVLVQVGPRHNIAPAIEMLTASPSAECRVIVEAGDLKKSSPLRKACESAKSVAALPCYPDGARDIARLIDEEMRAAKLTLAPDARAALTSLLGGDRLASRSELHKLALYAMGKERVELDDVRAVVTDASEQEVDGAIDAAFAGKISETESEFAKARGSVGSAGAIVSAALRHVAMLHKVRLFVDDGDDPKTALKRGAPFIHFSRADAVETALRNWTSARLLRAMQQLAAALLETRLQADLSDSIARRTLLSLAMSARRNH